MKEQGFVGGQKMAIVHGILCIVIILLILQLWLFTATMEAYLGGDDAILWPAALASLVCLLLNAGLFRYLFKIDKRS